MTIEGVHPFPKFCATYAVATTSSGRRTKFLQCNIKLSQASTETAQSLKTLAIRDFRSQSHYWVDGFKALYGIGARRLLNPPMNALHSLCSLYSLSATRLEKRSLFTFRVSSFVDAVIIDIQEKADGSVLFKFEHKERLLSINQPVYTLLQGPRGDPRLYNNSQLMKYLNPLYQREDRAFYSWCSENENDRLGICNFYSTDFNYLTSPQSQMMLKQSGSLDPGDCSCAGVCIVSDSNVAIVKQPSLPSEEMNVLTNPPNHIGFLYNPYKSDSAGGLHGTNILPSHVIGDTEKLICLPCSSSIKRASILPTLMSNFIKMKIALQYCGWPKNSSKCNDCYDVLFQNKVMQSNRGENVKMMRSFTNARKLDWADSSSSSATLNMIDKDNLEPFSDHFVPILHERKKLGLKEKKVKRNNRLRVIPTNENCVLSRKQLKKSGGRNHPQPRESIRKPTSNARDLFSKSAFQEYELFLTYRFTNDLFRNFKYKQVKKACLDIANVLNQLAVGLAGSGLAIILFIVSRLLKLNSTFDCGKVSALLRGFCLIWMSTAIQNFRTLILKLCYGSNRPAEDEVRRLHREMKNLSWKALTATVLSLICYVK